MGDPQWTFARSDSSGCVVPCVLDLITDTRMSNKSSFDFLHILKWDR